MNIKLIVSSLSMLLTGAVYSQNYISPVWSPDLGNGKYKNPVIDADYSDPDVTRVGDDYYMISSSFNHAPGLPILHSKDMINWRIIGHALQRQIPEDIFKKVQHGNGVWAPAIRFHQGEFYIYYPDPDYGIYMTKAADPTGAWSDPILVFEGKGLIDPCPFWDEDGENYLAFAYAGSRAGLKSVLAIAKLNDTGDKVLDRGVIVYDGHVIDPTIEGPKVHKRNGYYYLFAPSGGVATGWQLVLRSKNIYGPYERKVVMEQGKTVVNGPHQGAWVDTPSGEDWFFHFQDKDAMGRVVHLQPMKWVDDWPVIGEDKDGDGIGNPVLEYKKPNVGNVYPINNPVESDEFETQQLGLQWQWQGNPDGTWLTPSHNGYLRLYTQQLPTDFKNMLDVPNILTQKFPAENFKATAKVRLVANEKDLNEKAGFIVVGEDYSQLYIAGTMDRYALFHGMCTKGLSGKAESVTQVTAIDSGFIYLQVRVTDGINCNWYYSVDNKEYNKVGETFKAKPGKWIGATLGLYATREQTINDSGFAEVDWFRVDKL